jgi:hypothetical protein
MLLYSVVHKEMIDINTSTVNIWTPEYSKNCCKEHSLYERMYVIYASPTLVSLSIVSFRKTFCLLKDKIYTSQSILYSRYWQTTLRNLYDIDASPNWPVVYVRTISWYLHRLPLGNAGTEIKFSSIIFVFPFKKCVTCYEFYITVGSTSQRL